MISKVGMLDSENSTPILLAGAGEGVAKVLRDAESNATYTYFLAMSFAIFSLIVIGWAIRCIWCREENGAVTQALLSQLAPMISGGFSAWVAYEIITRLMS